MSIDQIPVAQMNTIQDVNLYKDDCRFVPFPTHRVYKIGENGVTCILHPRDVIEMRYEPPMNTDIGIEVGTHHVIHAIIEMNGMCYFEIVVDGKYFWLPSAHFCEKSNRSNILQPAVSDTGSVYRHFDSKTVRSSRWRNLGERMRILPYVCKVRTVNWIAKQCESILAALGFRRTPSSDRHAGVSIEERLAWRILSRSK